MVYHNELITNTEKISWQIWCTDAFICSSTFVCIGSWIQIIPLCWIIDKLFIQVIKRSRAAVGYHSNGCVSFQTTGSCPWRSSSLTSLMVSSRTSRCRSCTTPSTGGRQSKLIFSLDVFQLCSHLRLLLLSCCLARRRQHFTSLEIMSIFQREPRFWHEGVCSSVDTLMSKN